MCSQEEGEALIGKLRIDLLPFFPYVKDIQGPFYKKRPPGMVKAHLLLLAHFARVEIPPPLLKDYHFVLKKAPRLLQEMFTISSLPFRVKVRKIFALAILCS